MNRALFRACSSARAKLAGLRTAVQERSPAPALSGEDEPARAPFASEREVIQASGLFDGDWYLSRYEDVAQAEADPLEHYMAHGLAEGRQPHPLFDPAYYYRLYPDVAEARVEPLLHYITHGSNELRSPHPLFDAKTYASRVSVTPEPPETLLGHFLTSAGRTHTWPFDLTYETLEFLTDPDLDRLTHYVERVIEVANDSKMGGQT